MSFWANFTCANFFSCGSENQKAENTEEVFSFEKMKPVKARSSNLGKNYNIEISGQNRGTLLRSSQLKRDQPIK